jgi:hypothetical protein
MEVYCYYCNDYYGNNNFILTLLRLKLLICRFAEFSLFCVLKGTGKFPSVNFCVNIKVMVYKTT